VTDPTARPTLAHLPALDGLRGLAVLGVLFFHDDRLKGGYLGVDLFFVLSGYLITSLLLREKEATGAIALGPFWIRRARRLFPALLALIPAVGVYAVTLADKTELGRIRGDGLATLAYVANWRSIFAERSYWEMFLAPSPLEHTWSLAIEEQFYVVWPLLVTVVLVKLRRSSRALLGVSIALAAASMIAMARLFDPTRSERAYLGTDTRGAAILVGAALACALVHRRTLGRGATRALDAAGLVATLGLAWAWVRLDGMSPFLYRGGFWLTEAAVLVLIACAAFSEHSLVARALAFAPLRWVGLVSYGVYLWHWPIFVALSRERAGFGGIGLTALRLGLTFGVAYVSYRWLEQPIRKHGLPFGRPRIVVPGAFAASALALVCCTRGGKPPAPQALVAPGAPEPTASAGASAPRDRHGFPPRPTPPDDRVRVLVVGDSVAQALGERLFFVEDRQKAFVAERGVGDCSIMEGVLPTHSLTNVPHAGGNCAAKWQADAKELRPDVTLVLLGGGFFAPIQIDGTWQRVCDAPARTAYVAELVSLLTGMGPDAGHVVVARVPKPVGHWHKEIWDQQTACFNDAMSEVASKVPGATVLDLYSEICPKDECVLEDQGALIRPDGMHFGGLGAERTAEWVLGQIGRQLR
jgi:peptidoglycan/LPS O-acetylase OafA/YrhL